LSPSGNGLRLREPPPRRQAHGSTRCKFATSEDRQATLRGTRAWRGPNWAWTKTSCPHNKRVNRSYGHCSRRPRRHASAPSGTQLSSLSTTLRFSHPPLSRGVGTRETYAWYYGTCMGVV
jgi:hypothetical protein